MNRYIVKRVLEVANHILDTKETIRETAKKFNISKSTVHKDLQERLSQIDINKYNMVKKIMNEHIETRHIKGGESTRQLFLRKRQVTL
ncbi:MAG: sporulation transcriptional regulator SpoIIID [Bacilli bacterium]|nr:sporulation transcriptional regulator SpoIIID [Bacilli bacterium]